MNLKTSRVLIADAIIRLSFFGCGVPPMAPPWAFPGVASYDITLPITPFLAYLFLLLSKSSGMTFVCHHHLVILSARYPNFLSMALLSHP
jgi:hypothetical protein